MCEIATYLKVGSTALVLKMIEDDFITDDFTLAEPVRAMKAISHDTSLKSTVELEGGRQVSAIEVQWEYLRLAKKYAQDNDMSEVETDVLERWENVLDRLDTNPMSLTRELDWVAKLSVMQAYRDRDGLEWDSPKLRMVDLQWHDVRRDKGLYHKLVASGKIDRLVSDADVDYAIDHPPTDTRAYFRGECLRRFSDVIVAASWDALIFDLGDEPLRKVPTLEPTRGTKAHVDDLLAASPDAATLIANLGA
jgi:proteasome accessory factor A